MFIVKIAIPYNSDPMTQNKDSEEKIKRQLETIEKLARRLPWIVLFLSLLAFAVILLEILFKPLAP